MASGGEAPVSRGDKASFCCTPILKTACGEDMMRELKLLELGAVSGGVVNPWEYETIAGEVLFDNQLTLPTVTVTESSITYSEASYAGFFDWNQNGVYEPWADEFELFANNGGDLNLPTAHIVEVDLHHLTQDDIAEMAVTLSTYFTPHLTS